MLLRQKSMVVKPISILLLFALLAISRSFALSLNEREIKSAFVYNFTRFVEFPSGVFASDDSPMIIGVIGDDLIRDKLVQSVKGKTVNGRKLVIKRFAKVRDIESSCHVLYIGSSERENLSRIMDKLKGSSILTIGDSNNFVEKGGIIGFVVDNKKVGFEVNLCAAKRADLKISSKLLQLAKDIID